MSEKNESTTGTKPRLCCPFCGSTSLFTEPDEWGSGGQWISPIHVGCKECKAEQSADTEEEAVERWNRRSSPAPSAPGDAQDDETQAILRWIMRTAESEKEDCGMDPETPAAIRNGRLAAIASAAAQALGLHGGPSYQVPAAGDALPTIKGAAITGGYVVVTPAGWGEDKPQKVRDAILRLFPVNPAYTPKSGTALATQQGEA